MSLLNREWVRRTGSYTYTWDAENRVASIDGKTLTYDALDRVAEEGTTLQILYGPTGKLGVQSGQTNARTYLSLPKSAGIIYDGSSVVYLMATDEPSEADRLHEIARELRKIVADAKKRLSTSSAR